MKMNQLGKIALSSLLGLTMLAGCGGSGSDGSDGKVVVNLASEPPEMNSFMNTDSTSGNVLRHTVEGLTTLDSNDNPVEGVAKSWDVSDDKLTYTFHLREDSFWNDGTQVTANDFKFAWDQLFTTHLGAGYASTWAVLIDGAEELMKQTETKEAAASEAAKKAYENVGYKVIDDFTFEVKLTGPYPYILGTFAFYSFAPVNEKFYTEHGGIDNYAKESADYLSNGPFVMTSWAHEDNIVLTKNDKYWNKDAIKLNEITFKMIDNTNTALNEFENGTIDMIGLNGTQAKDYRSQGKDVLNYDDGSVWYMELNTTKPGLNNAKVRKALTMGIDVQKFIDTVVLNESKIATSFTPPVVNNGEFTKAVGNVWERANGDYTEAKKLLEEGLKEEGINPADFKIELLGDEGDTGKATYEFVQEQLKTNLGVKFEVKQVPFKTRIQRMNDKQFDIVWAGWSLDYNDAMSYLDLWLTGGGNNHGGYSNAEYDKLVQDAYMEADVEKRTQMLVDAEKILAEDAAIGLTYWRSRDYICSDKLTGVQRSALRDMDLRFAETK